MAKIVQFADGTFGCRRWTYFGTEFLTIDDEYWPYWKSVSNTSDVPAECKSHSLDAVKRSLAKRQANIIESDRTKDHGEPLESLPKKIKQIIKGLYCTVRLLMGPPKDG